MTYFEALSDDEPEGGALPDSASELRLGRGPRLEPTPEGSQLDHTYSMDPPCKIHSFEVRRGSRESWIRIRIMRVSFADECGEDVGLFFSQVYPGGWVEVPTPLEGCLAPDTVSSHRDAAKWVLSRPGGPLADDRRSK